MLKAFSNLCSFHCFLSSPYQGLLAGTRVCYHHFLYCEHWLELGSLLVLNLQLGHMLGDRVLRGDELAGLLTCIFL